MLKAFDKICNEHRYIANIVKNSKKLKQPCAFPANLKIKCLDKSSCLCESKKSKHFRCIPKLQTSKFQISRKPFRKKRFKQFKFGKKKQQSGRKSPNCFLCGKPGHFTKNCLKANKKSVKIMQQIACASGYTENLFQNTKPLQSTDATFTTNPNKTVTIQFDRSKQASPSLPSMFPTQFMMQHMFTTQSTKFNMTHVLPKKNIDIINFQP